MSIPLHFFLLKNSQKKTGVLQNAINKEEERKEFPLKPHFMLKELFSQPDNPEAVLSLLRDTEMTYSSQNKDGFAVPSSHLHGLITSESMGLIVCNELFPQIAYISPGLVRALGYSHPSSSKLAADENEEDEEEEDSDEDEDEEEGDTDMKTDLLPSSSDDSMSGMFKQLPKSEQKKPSGPPKNLLDIIVRLKLFMVIQSLKEDQKARKMVISGSACSCFFFF